MFCVGCVLTNTKIFPVFVEFPTSLLCIFVYVRLCASLWPVYRVYLQARLFRSSQGFPKLIPRLENRKRKRLAVNEHYLH